MSAAREAERQSALMAALFSTGATDAIGDAASRGLGGAGLLERRERLQRGLAAYRANAAGIAERALAAAYPTVAALVGAEGMAALARGLWRASPPLRGDLAQWGQDLPGFIEALRDLGEWPYLADCARLDAAIQRCEAAADAALERETLALLAEQPPDALRLRLLPCVQLLASAWPVAAIHAAHAQADAPTADALERARSAVAARHAESVVVARRGWRAVASGVDASTFAWMQALQQGCGLAEAQARAGAGFEFDAWLLRALQQDWLFKAEPAPQSA